MRSKPIWQEIADFALFLVGYIKLRSRNAFRRFEFGKGVLVEGLYSKRGKYSRPFIHSGMVIILFIGVTLGPVIASQIPEEEYGEVGAGGVILGRGGQQLETVLSEKPRSEVVNYEVQDGDTSGGIAEKFGVELESVLWANNLTEKSRIKPGQIIRVPPVSGIVHKVKRGETIYSIAKKYKAEAQGIVNWPFNSFANDETFALAVGQSLVIPDGILPRAAAPSRRFASRVTPDAGTVTATGQFVWPTQGGISQNPAWYHMALDISNKAAPDVLAADSGTVTVAGFPDRYGYGNRVMINHGNGFETLYAHLSQIYVAPGTRVTRGTPIGRMGSTGRSTGTHLHFEIRLGGVLQNPWNYLK